MSSSDSWSSDSDNEEMSEVVAQLTAPSGTWSPSLYDPRQARLSRITEHTEPESRPTSMAFRHARAATDSSLPRPGRTNALIAQFENTSRSPSPSKSSRSSTNTNTFTGTFSPSTYASPSAFSNTYTQSPSTFSNTFSQPPSTYTNSPSTHTNTFSPSTYSPSTFTNTFTNSPSTFTASTHGPSTPLRRPNVAPRSPLASVRNIVAMWKDRSPGGSPKSPPRTESAFSASPPPQNEGLFAMRRRANRGASQPEPPVEPPTLSDTGSIRSSRPSLSASFDIAEFSPFSQSNEPPLHIGLLWYLNVHADPPYRWQRCQALLYPHILLLSWLAPGGGRGIVGLDLLNCTDVQSAPSPNHPLVRDDVGTIAAREQSTGRDAQPLMDMLIPFHMLYGDGVERLAAESLTERQRWVNRLWEAVNRPVDIPDSVSVTRSPSVHSIRTIESYNSDVSSTSSTHSRSNGSGSTVFVPPLSSIPDISDDRSSISGTRTGTGLSRRTSLASSHHRRTVDDTVIMSEGYVYPGDSRVIGPSRSNSLRRTASLTDLDEEFVTASSTRSSQFLEVPRAPSSRAPSSSSSSSRRSSGYDTAPHSIEKRSSASSLSDDDREFFSGSSASGSSRSSEFTRTSLTAPATGSGSLATVPSSGFPFFGFFGGRSTSTTTGSVVSGATRTSDTPSGSVLSGGTRTSVTPTSASVQSGSTRSSVTPTSTSVLSGATRTTATPFTGSVLSGTARTTLTPTSASVQSSGTRSSSTPTAGSILTSGTRSSATPTAGSVLSSGTRSSATPTAASVLTSATRTSATPFTESVLSGSTRTSSSTPFTESVVSSTGRTTATGSVLSSTAGTATASSGTHSSTMGRTVTTFTGMTSSMQPSGSTLSYRGSDSASFLGDSHDGSSTESSSSSSPYSSPTPSRTQLSRAGGVRRRTAHHSSRSFSSGYPSEDSLDDKENSSTYSSSSETYPTYSSYPSDYSLSNYSSDYSSSSYPSDRGSSSSSGQDSRSSEPSSGGSNSATGSGASRPTYTTDQTGYDVCYSSDLTYTSSSATSETYTHYTHTPLSIPDSFASSSDEGFATASQATSFRTASTPSTISSFKSLPSIPSESRYMTVDSGSTTFDTASEYERDEVYETAPTIPSEPSTPRASTESLPDLDRSPTPVPPSTRSSGTRSPTRSSVTGSPVRSSGTRSPVRSSGTRSPILSSGPRSPVRSGTISPVRSSATRSPARSSGTRSPIRSSGTRSPILSSGPRSPARSEVRSSGTRSSARSSGTRSPVRSVGAGSPILTSGTRSPVPTSGTRSPIRSSGTRSPIRSSGTRTPVRSSGTRTPPRSLTRSPASTHILSPPPSIHMDEQPVISPHDSISQATPSEASSIIFSAPTTSLVGTEQRAMSSEFLSSISTVSSLSKDTSPTPTELMPSSPSSILLPYGSPPSPAPTLPSLHASSPTPSPFAPSSPTDNWDRASSMSYDSSILLPSPSVRSFMIPEGPDVSFETSILRPNGSQSSEADALETLPQTPTTFTSHVSSPVVRATPLVRPSPVRSPVRSPPLVRPPSLVHKPQSVHSPQPIRPPQTAHSSPFLQPPETAHSSLSLRTPSSVASSVAVPAQPRPDSWVGTDISSSTESTAISSSTASSLTRQSSTSSTLSYISQSSLSSSIFDPSEMGDLEEERELELSTEPSLLSTRSPSPTSTATVTARPPSPPRTPTLPTPNPSMRASISTPTGHIPSIHTIDSETRRDTVTATSTSPEPLSPDVDDDEEDEEEEDLVDELRRYDNNRALENEQVLSRLEDIQNVLQDLLERPEGVEQQPYYLPPPPQPGAPPVRRVPVIVKDGPGPPIRRVLEVPDETHPYMPSSPSETDESVGSFLSSHHSEDWTSEMEDESMPSPELFISETATSPYLTITTPSTATTPTEIITSPPPSSTPPDSPTPTTTSTSSSSSSVSTVTVTERPLPAPQPQYAALLNIIRQQLDEMSAAQRGVNGKLDDILNRPDISSRIDRIEQMLHSLMHRPLDRAPSKSEVESLTDTDYLSSDYEPVLPSIVVPEPRQPRRALAEELERILSQPPNIRPAGRIADPPSVIPFLYQPTEGRPPRSPSLSSELEGLENWPRRESMDTMRMRPRPRPATAPPLSRQRPESRPTTAGDVTTTPTPTRMGNQPTTPAPVPVPERTPHVEPARPIMPGAGELHPRPPSAPEPRRSSPRREPWYRPARPHGQGFHPGLGPQGPGFQINVPPVSMPVPPPPVIPAQTQRVPPSDLDLLMEILRENRLAQLATVDQQRELMRYMRGLNEWLARDVNDRQNELRGVLARVDQLANQMRNIQRPETPSSDTSTSTEETPPQLYAPVVPQPTPVVPSTFAGGFVPPPGTIQQGQPVIPQPPLTFNIPPGREGHLVGAPAVYPPNFGATPHPGSVRPTPPFIPPPPDTMIHVPASSASTTSEEDSPSPQPTPMPAPGPSQQPLLIPQPVAAPSAPSVVINIPPSGPAQLQPTIPLQTIPAPSTYAPPPPTVAPTTPSQPIIIESRRSRSTSTERTRRSRSRSRYSRRRSSSERRHQQPLVVVDRSRSSSRDSRPYSRHRRRSSERRDPAVVIAPGIPPTAPTSVPQTPGYPPVMMTPSQPQVIIRDRSSSRETRRHYRTPPPQTIIREDSGGHSQAPIILPTAPTTATPAAQPIILPSQQPMQQQPLQQPQVLVTEGSRRSRSRSSRHHRRHSRSPPGVVVSGPSRLGPDGRPIILDSGRRHDPYYDDYDRRPRHGRERYDRYDSRSPPRHYPSRHERSRRSMSYSPPRDHGSRHYPSRRHVRSPGGEYRYSSSRRGSRTPPRHHSRHHSRTPPRHHSRSPTHRRSRSSTHRHSRTPPRHHSRVSSPRRSLSPSHRRPRTPPHDRPPHHGAVLIHGQPAREEYPPSAHDFESPPVSPGPTHTQTRPPTTRPPRTTLRRSVPSRPPTIPQAGSIGSEELHDHDEDIHHGTPYHPPIDTAVPTPAGPRTARTTPGTITPRPETDIVAPHHYIEPSPPGTTGGRRSPPPLDEPIHHGREPTARPPSSYSDVTIRPYDDRDVAPISPLESPEPEMPAYQTPRPLPPQALPPQAQPPQALPPQALPPSETYTPAPTTPAPTTPRPGALTPHVVPDTIHVSHPQTPAREPTPIEAYTPPVSTPDHTPPASIPVYTPPVSIPARTPPPPAHVPPAPSTRTPAISTPRSTIPSTPAPIVSEVRPETPIVTIRPGRDYPPTSPTTHIDFAAEDARLGRVERLESQLQNLAIEADQAEEAREHDFRNHEEERDRIFLENEERRLQEARETQQAIRDLIAATQSQPPPVIPGSVVDVTTEGHPPSGDPSSPSSIPSGTPSGVPSGLPSRAPSRVPSMRASDHTIPIPAPEGAPSLHRTESVLTSATRDAAHRHVENIISAVNATLSSQRDALDEERARVDAERQAVADEREDRIRALEEELASVKAQLESERQLRITEENEARERDRAEREERDDSFRAQLTDITNLVQEQRDVCDAKKTLQDERWAEKEERRREKDAQIIELRDLVQQMNRDMTEDRQKLEDYRREKDEQPGADVIIAELTKQNAEQQELLRNLSESWRADWARQHQDTLDAVRDTAEEKVHFNVQGYLDDFSKSLASEVKILLGEVGQLREERRALQHELGYLLCMKSKYGPGGEFEPDWKPPSSVPGPPPGPPEPPAVPPELPHARPAWRSVPGKKKKKSTAPAAAPPAPPAVPPAGFMGPPMGGPPPGAFMPHGAQMRDARQQISSWATWQPDPANGPSPSNVEPTLLVPDRGSPGLFGPRSPRDSRA